MQSPRPSSTTQNAPVARLHVSEDAEVPDRSCPSEKGCEPTTAPRGGRTGASAPAEAFTLASTMRPAPVEAMTASPIRRMGTSVWVAGGSLAERYDAHQRSACPRAATRLNQVLVAAVRHYAAIRPGDRKSTRLNSSQ